MKKLFFATLVSVAALAAFSAPRKVVLIVQNHTSDVATLPMSAFADTLATRLSGNKLQVIVPDNVIGVQQNRTAVGETMPEVSVQEMGRMQNADGVIVASIQEVSGEDIEGTDFGLVGRKLRVRLSITLMDSATGATICGVDGVEFSKNYNTNQVKSNGTNLYERLLHGAATNLSAQLLAKMDSVEWEPKEVRALRVFFGCNVLGADVQIDGQSYGTCPAEFSVTPGSHSLLVSYPPYYYDFKRRVEFNQDGQTYKVVLQITPEGESQRDRAIAYELKLLELENARRNGDFEYEKKKKLLVVEIAERCGLFQKQMELANAMLDRYALSGEADDYVRKTIADGTAVYWKNSFGRIAITDGFADNVEFATPKTETGDLTSEQFVKPDIAQSLKDLLMNRVGQ